MTRKRKIQAIFAAAARPAECKDARLAWVKQRMAELRAAGRTATEAWDRMFDALPDDLSEEEVEALPEPPEQAAHDAILAEMRAVADEDKWPREMYFGGI